MPRPVAAPTGVLPVCKPPGMTSHDVVSSVRRLIGERHIGHAGTLDPAAAGVLVLLIGRPATRLAGYLLDQRKIYAAEVHFGRMTDTDDFTGRVIAEAPPEQLAGLDPAAVQAALGQFEGEIRQVPPMVSAVRVGGERLYRLAREGVTVRRTARTVFIYQLSLLETRLPTVRLRITCSSGTYVRALAADLGRVLGVGAHLGFLVREAVGRFRLEDSLTLEETAEAVANGRLASIITAPSEALDHLEGFVLGAAETVLVRHGTSVSLGEGVRPPTEDSLVRLLGPDGALEAVGAFRGGRLRPVTVFRGGGEP